MCIYIYTHTHINTFVYTMYIRIDSDLIGGIAEYKDTEISRAPARQHGEDRRLGSFAVCHVHTHCMCHGQTWGFTGNRW